MNRSLLLLVVTSLLMVLGVQASLKQSEFGPKILELLEVLHMTCAAKSGTDESSIAKVIQGEFTDEPKIKNYMKCLFMDSGVIEETGDFNMEMVAQLLPPKILDESVKVIRKCSTKIKGAADLEDKIFAFLKCYYYQNPDIFIFF